MINSKQRMSLYSLLLFTLFFNFNNQVFAEKSLLWRISGNGLSKPSYLYGTIHLKYSKLFDIGDSAFIALKNCDAFAGEIYLDSIFIYAMSGQNDLENKYNINYDSLFTKEEKELINKRLFKNTNLNLEDYNKQPISYLFEALYNTDNLGYQRETILDGYLFYNAKCLNKKLLSVEYFNEYADLLKLLEVKTNKIKEKILSLLNDTVSTQIIDSYLNQDIDAINNFYNTSVDSIFNYKLIIERNKKMIPRMDEMIKKYSMFFAIGAGHLGGSNGLINLLKERGYKVEPVIKKVTNISKNFKTNSKNVKWVEYQNSYFGYKVNLPDKPIPMSLNVSETINSSNIYVDLGSGIMYNSIAYQFEEKNTDKVLLTFDVIISSMKLKLPDCKEISKKTINNDSVIGYEIELNSSNNWLKILILKKDDLAYMFITKTNILNKDNYDIDRFYKNIKFIESDESKWITYSAENGDFSVDLPGKPEYYSLPVGNTKLKKIESYSKQNIKEKKEFNIYVYTFPDGHIMKEKEKMRDVIKTEFPIENKYDSTECLINGLNCVIYKTKPNKEQKSFLKMGINFVNRIYILSASNNSDTSFTDMDRFIKSFKINLKSNENLYNYKFNDCSFLLPSEPKIDTALSTNRDDYISMNYETSETSYAQDTTLGFTWIFQIHTFNEFYKSKSDSIAVFKHLDDIRSFTDTLIYSKF